MKPWRGALATMTGLGVVLCGCASLPSTVNSNEDLLAASGFRVLAGNTPGYAAAEQELPPHKFVHHTVQGIETYYYFDPTVCGCLYYGSEANWDAYRQAVSDKLHMQAEQLLIRDDTPYSGQGGL
jgi:hypothetical protein